MSADTGAREPQDSVSALLQRAQEVRVRAEAVLRHYEIRGTSNATYPASTNLARDVVALTEEVERLAALAAGVGVPPDAGWEKDFEGYVVSAPARERQDAREVASAATRAVNASAGDASGEGNESDAGAASSRVRVAGIVLRSALQAAREQRLPQAQIDHAETALADLLDSHGSRLTTSSEAGSLPDNKEGRDESRAGVGEARPAEPPTMYEVIWEWLTENNPAALELCPYKVKR